MFATLAYQFLLTGSPAAPSHRSAIVGATIVDVGDQGRSTKDIADSVVLVTDGRITAVGDRRNVPIPAGTAVIRAAGRYLVPGLIDGYGALRTPDFARAYLYEGVTTVIVPLAPADGSADGESQVVAPVDGLSALTGVPISGYPQTVGAPTTLPNIEHRLHDTKLAKATLIRLVDAAADAGHRVVAAGLDVWPDQLAAIVGEAHRRGLAVTAEVGFTTYPQAIKAGVDAFVRNDKYSLSLSRPEDFQAYADDPQGVGGRAAMRRICGTDDMEPALAAFAAQLHGSGVALMPTLSMEATADDLNGINPWTSRSAAFVKAADLDDPVEAATGARPYLESHPERRAAIQACARAKADIDRRLHAKGVTYIAGSTAASYGVLPGGGLHGELRLLQEIGLTPRESLAAATSSVAEALRLSDRGRIAPGRRADLVILASDPRRDVAAVDDIVAVYVSGKLVDRQSLLAAAKAESPAT